MGRKKKDNKSIQYCFYLDPIADQEIIDLLKNSQNISETVRDGLRLLADKKDNHQSEIMKKLTNIEKELKRLQTGKVTVNVPQAETETEQDPKIAQLDEFLKSEAFR